MRNPVALNNSGLTASSLRIQRAKRVTRIVQEAWRARFLSSLLAASIGVNARSEDASAPADLSRDISYNNYRKPAGPWSIHVVRVPRQRGEFLLGTAHATGKALGLSPVAKQAIPSNSALGIPVAAINGDFYQRDGPYAGDPRGLQIMNGELISAPTRGASFCIDAIGDPHTIDAVSRLQVTWPNGLIRPIGLNEGRPPDRATLYTSALGASTRTAGGREFILEQQGENPWLPLRPGRTYRARIREIRASGDTQIQPGTMVLSIGPGLLKATPTVEPGAELSISTLTEPSLRGVRTAISGGPVLVRNGKRERFKTPDSDSYEFSSMMERHPRSAIGWNENYFYLVTVDGRQKGVSVGMNLNELAACLVELGCQEAMNLDGGGSATLWFNGKVQNHPCDGYERDVANSLIVFRKPARTPNTIETPERRQNSFSKPNEE